MHPHATIFVNRPRYLSGATSEESLVKIISWVRFFGLSLLCVVSRKLALFLKSPGRPLKSNYFFELGKWHLIPVNVFVILSPLENT